MYKIKGCLSDKFLPNTCGECITLVEWFRVEIATQLA
jgi:hypothetical protein